MALAAVYVAGELLGVLFERLLLFELVGLLDEEVLVEDHAVYSVVEYGVKEQIAAKQDVDEVVGLALGVVARTNEQERTYTRLAQLAVH